MHVYAYLTFNGQCEEAFNFYAECLGGTIKDMMPHEGTPAGEQVPAEWRSKILHANMQIGDGLLMASDAPPGYYEKPQGMSVSLHLENVAEAERIYNALSADGTITMPMQQTFWAARFAMFTDKFGIPWMINSGDAEQSA